MPESTQMWLSRSRPPRVQITYEVETGGAIEKKELPFVAGILADLSGTPDSANPLPPLKERKFVEIDRDNFDAVLAAAKPRLVFDVPNRLVKDGPDLSVALQFERMEDFAPVKRSDKPNGKVWKEQKPDGWRGLIMQVENMRKLFEARTRLVDLLAKLDGNDDLDQKLKDVISQVQSSKTDAKQKVPELPPPTPPGKTDPKANPSSDKATT